MSGSTTNNVTKSETSKMKPKEWFKIIADAHSADEAILTRDQYEALAKASGVFNYGEDSKLAGQYNGGSFHNAYKTHVLGEKPAPRDGFGKVGATAERREYRDALDEQVKFVNALVARLRGKPVPTAMQSMVDDEDARIAELGALADAADAKAETARAERAILTVLSVETDADGMTLYLVRGVSGLFNAGDTIKGKVHTSSPKSTESIQSINLVDYETEHARASDLPDKAVKTAPVTVPPVKVLPPAGNGAPPARPLSGKRAESAARAQAAAH